MRRPAHLEHLPDKMVELGLVYSTIFIGVEHAVVDLAHGELGVLSIYAEAGQGGEGGPEAGGHRCGGRVCGRRVDGSMHAGVAAPAYGLPLTTVCGAQSVGRLRWAAVHAVVACVCQCGCEPNV